MVAERPIGTIGLGRMGRGIAVALAFAGQEVLLIDLKPRDHAAYDLLATETRGAIRRDLALLARVGLLDAGAIDGVLAQVACVPASCAGVALARCGLIFEAVPETLDAKRDCFAAVSEHAPAGTIIASTTSTIDADTLAAMVTGPERFLNAHWLNPAFLIPLVEIGPAALTSEEALSTLRGFLAAIGKVPVICRSSPGFIVPRIQALAMNEAARMVEEGVASAEDIDTAIRAGFGLRFAVLGLLEFIDWGGADILDHASGFLSSAIDPRFAAPDVVSRNVREKRGGLDDGQGFYDYSSVDIDAYRDERLQEFVALLRTRGLEPRRG